MRGFCVNARGRIVILFIYSMFVCLFAKVIIHEFPCQQGRGFSLELQLIGSGSSLSCPLPRDKALRVIILGRKETHIHSCNK